MSFSRRVFLRHSGQALAAAGLAGVLPVSSLRTRKKVSPSDTIVVAGIGVKGQGFSDLEGLLKQPGVVCGGLCDVDQVILDQRVSDVERRTGKKPPAYRDFRALLENKTIDAVVIGTPDHWHCLIAVLAIQAGKDVYVEKPMANSIAEADVIRKAARASKQVVAVGQQQRSGPHWQEVVRYVREGTLGKLRHVRAWANFNYGASEPRIPDEPPPPTLDYDLWLGPAPDRPYNASRVRYWRFAWDYGGGLQTDWGAHLLDIPLWALDVQGAPKSVTAIGGIYAYPGNLTETADTQTVLYEMDGFNLTWEHTGGIQSGPYGRNYGLAFVGTYGTLVVDRAGWEVIPEYTEGKARMEAVPLRKATANEHEEHLKNFLDRIRDRKDPQTPVEAGYMAAFYSHLGNIAYRTGSRLAWDETNRRFHQNEAANALLAPDYRTPWTLPAL